MRVIGWLCGLSVVCATPSAVVAQALPDAPSHQLKATLVGTVEDGDEALLPGARVEVVSGGVTTVAFADGDGVFHVYGVTAGAYTLRITADGFYAATQTGTVQPGEEQELATVALRALGQAATVTVTASEKEIATEQVKFELQQRILGVIPNFYVVYDANPAPLSKGQKFHLFLRSAIDPYNLGVSAVAAGVEQANNTYSGYGQGAAGYAKRYGAAYADGSISGLLGGAVFPVIFRQDPRYRFQGSGTVMSRTRHALASVVICRSDTNKRVFNYSNILGNFAAAGISNLYYPEADRNGAGLTLRNAALGTAFGGFAAIMQEFVVPKLTPHLNGRNKRD
ncbi:MAG: carboxypeptidase-like regulatory domain-containing protein [Terriglobus sp.]